MTISPIRVLLCDDHRFFRDGVRTLLMTIPDIEIVGEANNGEECVLRAAERKPNVILMDVQMPGLNGVEATRRILRDNPDVGVVMLTMFEDTDLMLSAMRAGARGYILKDADEEELIRSVRAVARGEALFGPAVARRLLNYITDVIPASKANPFPELTDRERDVLAGLARGLTNQDVADQMELSLKTVRNHVSSILTKLRVVDRAEAISRARDAGLAA